MWWMSNPDESVCLGPDVEVDGSCDRDVVRPVDAGVVQQMVLDVDDTDELFCLDELGSAGRCRTDE